MNALMPGEHDWLDKAKPSAPSVSPEPQKKSGLMNALGAVFKYGAPEAYEQGRQRKIQDQAGNALAMGDYRGAAEMMLRGGNLDGGLQLMQYADSRQAAGAEQEAALRQQQAQGTLSLFSQMEPDQITNFALEQPQEFERITGMSSDEYMQAGAQMRQGGMDPAQFRQFVIQKAQAELGQMPEQVKYESKTDALGRPLAFNPSTGEYGEAVGGAKPEATNGIVYDPTNPSEVLADHRTPSQTGEMTDYERAQIAEQRRQAAQPDRGRWQSAGDGVIFNTATGETMGGTMTPYDYGATGTFDANTGMGNPFQSIEMYDQGGRLYQADFGGQGLGGQEYQPPQPAGRKPTDFDKTQDREMAKDIADWKTTGQATALTSLAKLRDVIEELEDPNSQRGGAYMAMMPEGMKPLLAPNTVNTKEMAESVVQSSLKAVLGGQFAQKEADALFARTYNPALSDEVNAERLKRLYNEMVNRAAINESAARYADQYGTLQGFEGYLPGLQDFMMSGAEPTSGPAEPQGGVVRIQDAQGYASLPSGTTYIAPDGTTRRKP
jgi:hypothetical protein